MRWSILVLVLLALSGCSEVPEERETSPEPNEPSEPDPSDPEPSDPGPSDPEPSPNNAPTAILTADVTEGSAPLSVVFTVDGSDPDGDALSWRLTIAGEDEEGTELPSDVEHSFPAGNHSVRLTVSDGDLEDAQSIHILVQEATISVPEAITWSGSAVTGDRAQVAGCIVYESENDAFYLDFDAALAGYWMYNATGDPSIGHVITEWWSGETPVDLGAPAKGTIPEGADNVAVCSDTPVDPMDFTITLHHPDDPAFS